MDILENTDSEEFKSPVFADVVKPPDNIGYTDLRIKSRNGTSVAKTDQETGNFLVANEIEKDKRKDPSIFSQIRDLQNLVYLLKIENNRLSNKINLTSDSLGNYFFNPDNQNEKIRFIKTKINLINHEKSYDISSIDQEKSYLLSEKKPGLEKNVLTLKGQIKFKKMSWDPDSYQVPPHSRTRHFRIKFPDYIKEFLKNNSDMDKKYGLMTFWCSDSEYTYHNIYDIKLDDSYEFFKIQPYKTWRHKDNITIFTNPLGIIRFYITLDLFPKNV